MDARIMDLVPGAVSPPSDGERHAPASRTAVRATAALAAVLLAGTACAEREFGPTDPGLAAEVDILFEVPEAEAASSSATADPTVARAVTVSESGPSLVVDSVDVAIRELQLGREGTTCEFGPVGTGGDGGDGNDCEEASIQTVLQGLPVNAADGTEVILENGLVEPGTLDRFAFRLNVLDGEADEEITILQDRSDMQDASVFVGGTYEGEPFELYLDPDEEVVVEAESPLTLETGEQGTVALVWNVASWFVDPDDGGIEDPNEVAADDALEQQVEDRIVETLGARMTR